MSQISSCDNELTSAIVQHLKSGGIFDQFRRDCLSDADTKPSFQNLLQRVEGYVSKFLSQQRWHQSSNKNQLRERLRAQINESGMLKYGIEHLVDQAVNPKINSLFLPRIESVVKHFLGINDNIIKDNIKNESAKDENSLPVELSHIKKEPNDENSREEPQPMDIETDSECSRDALIVNVKIESIQSEVDSDNHYVDWPTPPQPEMLTPDRNEETRNTFNDNSQSEDTKPFCKLVEESSVGTSQQEDVTTTSLDKFDYKILDKNLKKVENREIIKKENTKVEDLSDVSSVHTSDLSDFDDEISLSSNDDGEDSKKKKISLKVVKEITSREQSKESAVKTGTSNETRKQSKLDKKRIRKVNPKYASNDFSSIFSEKRIQTYKNVTEEEFENSNNFLQLTEKAKLSTESKIRKRRSSNNSDNDVKESDDSNQKNSKLSMITEELPADSRCSSRASAESSSYSETTQDSVSSHMKSSKRRASKSRNESQTQRYEASDLYKPRPMISSSARSTRTRRPTTPTPESTSQLNTHNIEGTDNFVIHDLSK